MAATGKVASLLFGTTSGVYRVALPEGRVRPLGLQGYVVNHVFSREPGTALVACPELRPMFQNLGLDANTRPQHTPGLFEVSFAPEEPSAEPNITQLWAGNAHACSEMATASGGRRLLVGTEPADVLHSDDGGKTWTSTNSFQSLPTRSSWYFPAEPHQPHVLSFDYAIESSSTSSSSSSSGANGQQQQQQQDGRRLVVAGIEVGSVVVTDADSGMAQWEENTTGLNPDVHSCRADPHHPSRLFAVTGGGGGLPGGMYVSNDAGKSWRHLSKGLERARYTVGLAINAYREGELLMTAGQRPPFIGTEVYHSTDGGESWQDITAAVLSAAAAYSTNASSPAADGPSAAGGIGGAPNSTIPQEVSERVGQYTPVAYFTKQGAVLGMSNGDVLVCGDVAGQAWHVACQLPDRITAIMAEDGISSPSAVSH